MGIDKFTAVNAALICAGMSSGPSSTWVYKNVYRFISSKEGEKTMAEAKLNQTHKDLLQYFSSMILDPDGHKRWMAAIREDLNN